MTDEAARAAALGRLNAAILAIDGLSETLVGLGDELEEVRKREDSPPRRSTLEAAYDTGYRLGLAQVSRMLRDRYQSAVAAVDSLARAGPNPTDRAADLERI